MVLRFDDDGNVAVRGLIASYLWKRYEMSLPESPGYVAAQLIGLLKDNGYAIVSVLDATPQD